ncbi:GNAT family N-acetyltransferase [Thiosocius teredinicola]|uniref:GNAT family N-acetyltransferase n=1 Tax=Thiosocius teredinicola TaxID=1973002 RepID=UPI0013DE3C3B
MFNDRYQEQMRLPGGQSVRLRLIQPHDKELLRQGFQRLSSASRHKRFMGGKQSISDAELRYFTELDQRDHFAIGAVELNADGAEGEGIAVARFVRLGPESDCAEVAITVADDLQGKGVGRKLLEKLVEAAVERDIRRFRFECLADNHEMRRLVYKVSEVVEIRSDDGVIVAEVELPGAHHESAEHSMAAVERLFSLFRNVATNALDMQVNLGLDTLHRTLDMAIEHKNYWWKPWLHKSTSLSRPLN